MTEPNYPPLINETWIEERDQRLNEIEKKVNGLYSGRVNADDFVGIKMQTHEQALLNLEERFEKLESKVDAIGDSVSQIRMELDKLKESLGE